MKPTFVISKIIFIVCALLIGSCQSVGENIPNTPSPTSFNKLATPDQINDEEIQEERYYVVPLAKKGFEKSPRWKRSKKAMIVLREFLTRHMKPEGDVYISQELNERVWENGIKNPPRKIRIRCTKSVDGIVRAYLA